MYKFLIAIFLSLITSRADRKPEPYIVSTHSLNEYSLQLDINNPKSYPIELTLSCGSDRDEPIVRLPAKQISTVQINTNFPPITHCYILHYDKEKK